MGIYSKDTRIVPTAAIAMIVAVTVLASSCNRQATDTYTNEGPKKPTMTDSPANVAAIPVSATPNPTQEAPGQAGQIQSGQIQSGQFPVASAPAYSESPPLPAWVVPSADGEFVRVGDNHTMSYRSVWLVQHRGAPAYMMYSAYNVVSDGYDDLFDETGRLLCHVQGGLVFTRESCPWPADPGTVPVFVWAGGSQNDGTRPSTPLLSCGSCIAPQSSFSPWLAAVVKAHEYRPIHGATHEIWRVRHRGQQAYLLINMSGKGFHGLFDRDGHQSCTLQEAAGNTASQVCDRPIDAGTKPVLMWRHPQAPGNPADLSRWMSG